eukprot:gene10879-12094_t
MLSSWTWGSADFGSDNVINWNSKSQWRSKRSEVARTTTNQQVSFCHVAVQALEEMTFCGTCVEAPKVDSKTTFKDFLDRIRWDRWPASVHPSGGELPEQRIARKTEQIEAMLVVAIHLIETLSQERPHKLKVVEFCGGSGYLALPLAMIYPEVDFVLIDFKEESIARAHSRLAASELTNVEVILGDIREFRLPFDLGIALHACGSASDIVLNLCMHQRASFLLCPCCIGKVLSNRKTALSAAFQQKLSQKQFRHLAKAADSHHNTTESGDMVAIRRKCKLLLERDRCLLAEEANYTTAMTQMQAWASPKRDIIYGWCYTSSVLAKQI